MSDEPQNTSSSLETRMGVEAYGWLDLRWRDWWKITKRVADSYGGKGLGITAAGVAFFSFLALFPGAALGLALYGLFSDPAQVSGQVSKLEGVAPEAALVLLKRELSRLAEHSGKALGWGALLSLLGSLWSANRGVKSLMGALGIAYHQQQGRPFIINILISLMLTFLLILAILLALSVIIALPAFLQALNISVEIKLATRAVSWLIMLALAIGILSVLYRYGPRRENAKWRWITPGAILACVLWLVVSLLFTWFVSEFAHFNKTYGTLGALVILMLWIFNSAQLVILGACFNAETELQIRNDTTVKPPRPRGERGAWVADELPPNS